MARTFLRGLLAAAPIALLTTGGVVALPDEGRRNERPEHRILELTNRARARAGCPALRAAPVLARVAAEHSRGMARRDRLGHVDDLGRNHIQRALAAGYPSSYVGENVAAGNASALRTFRQWMTSPEHRSNILDCRFTELGVGHARDAHGRWQHYWTQMLGRP